MARILITGADGFIGGHLLPELADNGHDVIGIDRVDGDLRDFPTAGWLIARAKPDIVVHLAAKVGRAFGEDDPLETIADNTGMTANVARVCGQLGIRLVYASTSEVYGDNGDSICDEEDGPFTLCNGAYGLSKAHGEDYGRLYAPDGFTALRLSMPYGEGLPHGKGRAALINFVWQAMHRKPIEVHRGSERCWCYVADTVRGIRLVIEGTDGGAYNIGRDDNRTAMKKVAEMVCDRVGAPHSLIHEVETPGNTTVVKRLANQRLMDLGWAPTVELPEGIDRVHAWITAGEREFVAA